MARILRISYYGWWIVAACFVITFYTGGVIFFGFTAVFEPIVEEFGWSYAQVSLAASLRGLEMGALAPIVGLLVNRLGPKRLVLAGAVLIGLGLVLLSRITSLWMFYTSFVLVAMGMSTVSGTVLMAAVVSWFRKRMSIAIGFVVSGFAAGGILISLVTMLTELFDWRTAMVILAISTWVIVIPVTFLLRNPRAGIDIEPSGEKDDAPGKHQEKTSVHTAGSDFTVKQALKSRVFWQITITSMCHMALLSPTVTHITPYFTSVGIDREVAGIIASIVSISQLEAVIR